MPARNQRDSAVWRRCFAIASARNHVVRREEFLLGSLSDSEDYGDERGSNGRRLRAAWRSTNSSADELQRQNV